jgi:hypothetical protein
LPHRWYPLSQAKSHAVPLQTAVACAGVVQVAQTPLHRRVPALQVKPQVELVHDTEEFAGEGHGEQLAPQLSTDVLDTHWLPQRWKPALQTKSHASPLQTGDAFAGVVQRAQLLPHRRVPGSHCTAQPPITQVATPFAGTGHEMHASPQLVGRALFTQR